MSIEDIEDMFQTDVQEQTAIAAAAAKADSDAEEEAKRTEKAVKNSPGPNKDKGKRFT